MVDNKRNKYKHFVLDGYTETERFLPPRQIMRRAQIPARDRLEGEFSQCRDRLRISENAKDYAINRLKVLEEDSIRLQGQIHGLTEQVAAIKAAQPVKKIIPNVPKGVQKVWQKKD